MKSKKGGGKRQQAFDEKTGRYVRINKNKSILALTILDTMGTNNASIKEMFPVYKGAETDLVYCEVFVRRSRCRIISKNIRDGKLIYLLTERPRDDKSKYLIEMGYNINEKEKLLNDILKFTDFETLRFNRINERTLNCEAKTILRGHIVTTCWQLTKDFELNFLTLLPKGEKKWK